MLFSLGRGFGLHGYCNVFGLHGYTCSPRVWTTWILQHVLYEHCSCIDRPIALMRVVFGISEFQFWGFVSSGQSQPGVALELHAFGRRSMCCDIDTY
jgi:hypothetical protein